MSTKNQSGADRATERVSLLLDADIAHVLRDRAKAERRSISQQANHELAQAFGILGRQRK